MASFLEKIRVKTAVEQSYTFTRRATHGTTLDMNKLGIGRIIWCPPGKYRLYWQTYSNMQPMPQPTFGIINYNNRVFWVPFRAIFKGWNDFIVDNIHTTGDMISAMQGTTPFTTIGDLALTIVDNSTPIVSGSGHFSYNDNGTVKVYEYTMKSKNFKRILNGLYGNFMLNPKVGVECSAMPILALARVYLDYYYNNGYKNDSDYLAVKAIVERDNNTLYVNKSEIETILNVVQNIFYANDLFVDCWDNPNHPNLAGQESTFAINDPNGDYTIVSPTTNTPNTGTPNVNNIDGKDPGIQGTQTISGVTNKQRWGSPITEFTLNTLKALTSYLKRHQLAGASTLQRLLARYGMAPDNIGDNIYEAGHETWQMEITPIFSNADTATAGGDVLGAYAAVGQGKGKGREYNIDTKEFGFILALNTIVPEVNYCDGFDGMALNLTKLDMWTPEFDNIGVDLLTAAELVTSNDANNDTNETAVFQQGFGFAPRYARWKVLKDILSGDYLCEPYKDQYERYFLQRKIDPTLGAQYIVHSKGFTQADSGQYNKIFYGYDPSAKISMDYFNLIHRMALETTSKMKPLYDYYDWEHEGGRKIELQNNGPTVQ